MGRLAFIWDLEDDPQGNYWHICVEGHGITREEVEDGAGRKLRDRDPEPKQRPA